MVRRILSAGLLGACLLTSAVRAGDATADAVNTAVEAWRTSDGIAAAAVAVTFKGALVGAYGEGGWNPHTPHPVASLSKAVTGACLAKLVDARKIALTDTMQTWLAPHYAELGQPVDPAFGQITVGQLLTHRAGLEKNTFGSSHDIVGAMKVTLATKLHSSPGTTFSYSDSGYLVVGYLIELASGRSYGEACLPALTAEGATGHLDASMPERAPNGGWDISAVDYALFLKALATSTSPLSPTMQAWVWHPGGKPAYSLGAYVNQGPHGPELTHTGLVHHDATHPRTGGSYFRLGADGYTVVVLFPGENPGKVYGDLTKAVEAALGTAPAVASASPPPTTPVKAATGAPTLTAVIDGKPWVATDVQSTYTAIGGRPVFNLSARHTAGTTSFLSFNLYETAAGKLDPEIALVYGQPLKTSHGGYNRNAIGGDVMSDSFAFETGSISIVYDAAHRLISGHFSGVAHNRTGQTIRLVNGQFADVGFDPPPAK